LKFVELHGRSSGNNPWSLRQMGIYQSFETDTRIQSCILLQRSIRLKAMMNESFAKGTTDNSYLLQHWSSIHLLMIASILSNWDSYAKFLDQKIDVIQNSVRFASTTVNKSEQVKFKDMQNLHYYIDLLLRGSYSLGSNIAVLENLSEYADHRQPLDAEDTKKHHTFFKRVISGKIKEQQMLKERFEHLHSRGESLALLLRDAIALRDNEIMKHHSILMSRESLLMKKMTQKSTEEAHTVKTITLVTLVYLPASFTASFLGMGYIHVGSITDGYLKINTSKDILVYLAITLPLMVLTLLGWFIWDVYSRKKHRQSEANDGDVEKAIE